MCPVNATYKNEEGVVVIDYQQCIGCRYCVVACPYSARTFDIGLIYAHETPAAAGAVLAQTRADDYERAANYEYGRPWTREREASPIGNVRKCHFCLHRLKNGMLPECVTTCIGRALYFGDKNDAQSLVNELLTKNKGKVLRIRENRGTEPRVYYLTDDPQFIAGFHA